MGGYIYGVFRLLFPVLETNRLRLDKLTSADSNSLFDLFSNNSVVEYYDLEAFTERSQAINLIAFFNDRFKDNSGIRWAIRLKKTNQLIGTCGFNTWSYKMKNTVIGYDLLPNFWGNGFTTEAVNRIVKSAFSGELPCGELNRIQGDTVLGNSASEALLLKVGFKEEGIRRQSGYWKNQFHDLKCFGLIKSEYREI
jgi:ribosomal-protein-alanine N-acetyltransferase